MKKLLLPLLAILLFTACQKEVSTPSSSEEFEVAQKFHENKIEVCHYDAETGTSHAISINENAWPAHQAHGDVLGDCSEAITTTICDQVWMVRNLDVSRYRNGDLIPQVTDPDEWGNLSTGAWCYYENNSANGAIYGKIYNWYAVNDPRGLAPQGFHVASAAEWITLSDCLGGELVAGGPLKSTGTIQDGTGLWESPNEGATNSSGFSAVPGGRGSPIFFTGLGFYNAWWTSTADVPGFALYTLILSKAASINLPAVEGVKNGLYVRCVKD